MKCTRNSKHHQNHPDRHPESSDTPTATPALLAIAAKGGAA